MADQDKPRVLTADDIKRIGLEAAKDGPAINYYGRNGEPPVGHRVDCNPRWIPAGKCVCAELERAGYEVKCRRMEPR
jgi:hypothetical protein